MIRRLARAARAAIPTDPFFFAAISLMVLSTSLHGISERIVQAREDLDGLAALVSASTTPKPAPELPADTKQSGAPGETA
jgi:hypothetical protein